VLAFQRVTPEAHAMRILLCLLSDQHVPNLLSAHHFRPDRLVLLESPAMRKRNAARNLVEALAAGGIKFQRDAQTGAGNLVVESVSQEDSLRDVQAALKSAYGRFPSDEWIVNVTGGTKPMSIAAFEFFRNLGASLIYVNNLARRRPRRNVHVQARDPRVASGLWVRPGEASFQRGRGRRARAALGAMCQHNRPARRPV